MASSLRKRTAQRDDHCDYCGYPFDDGDSCYGYVLSDGDFDWEVYCSRTCAEKHMKPVGEKERMS